MTAVHRAQVGWRTALWWAAPVAVAVAAIATGGMHSSAGVVLGLWSVPVVAAAVEDASILRLRDVVVGPGVVVSFVAVGLLATADSDAGVLFGSLLAAVCLAGCLLLMHLVSPSGMGFGDVKYGVLLGAGVGVVAPLGVVVVLMAATVLQVLVMVFRPWPAQRSGLVGRRAAPFGPALALSSVGFVVLVVALGGGRL